MSLQIDKVSKLCSLVQKQVKDTYKNLTIHFIIHHDGQKLEALGLAGQQLLRHPAAETGLHILSKTTASEQSSLIGIAVAKENILAGLASRDTFLALASLNIDQFKNLNEVRQQAFHTAWHAIDGVNYHNEVSQKQKTTQDVIVRRRNALELTGANLRADSFATIISTLQGNPKSNSTTAKARGNSTLLSQIDGTPEHYPFIVATEAVSHILKKIRKKSVHKRKHIQTAYNAAENIGKAFDEETLVHWLSFSDPAQDMAWRGFSREDILSASIHTSDDTYVRTTGYLVADIIGVTPSPSMDISESYSPYADDEFNKRLHNKVVDETFEDIIAEGLRYNDATPFIAIAQKQNKALAEGNALGWCAAAFQTSGRAFEYALRNGDEPETAARKEFSNERAKTKWSALKILSKKIVDKHREGDSVSMKDIGALAKNEPGTLAIRKSVDLSLQAPSATKTHSVKTPAPHSPAPAMQNKIAPATPAAAPMAPPGMGNPMTGGGVLQAQQPVQQTTPRAQNTVRAKNRASDDRN